MGKITFITGGQRSGKSSYASQLALKDNHNPIYLATSRVWDEDHKKRIERHQQDRGNQWKTIEEEKHISQHDWQNKTVLMDCVTLWLTNFFYDNNQDVEQSLNEAKKEIQRIKTQDSHFIIVSNELGMGGHPNNLTQMKFNDLQGWVNQFIAKHAEDVFLMVSGIPVKIKSN